MSGRAFLQGRQIICSECSAPLWPTWGEPPDVLPDVRGWVVDDGGDAWRLSSHALKRVRRGKRPAYRRAVPPQLLLGDHKQLECWRCHSVQSVAHIRPPLERNRPPVA
jgi:hypothetical protein